MTTSGRISRLRVAWIAWTMAGLAAASFPANAGEACYEHHYLGNDKPDEENPGWHEEAQGLAHDPDHWYVVQNVAACVLPEGHPLCFFPNSAEGCVLPRLACLGLPESCETHRQGFVFRIPVTQDLSNGGATAVATIDQDACATGFNHVGDPAYHDHEGSGFVLVPLEGAGPAVAAFGAELTGGMIDWAPLDPDASGQQSASWVAVDGDGILWSGSHEEIVLNRFSVDWDLLRDQGELAVSFLDHVTMLDEAGQPRAIDNIEQGGAFADDPELPFPLLYITNGDADNDCDCGVTVFEIREQADCDPSAGSCLVARRVDKSSNGSGPFNYQYNPGFSTYEEPEGVTFWDLDADPRAPGISGQLHVMMLDNDAPDDDDVYIKHYRLETDDVAPTITCPADAVAECTGNRGVEKDDPQLAAFFAGASAVDVCDQDVAITNDAPTLLPLGTNPVTFTATDDFRNESSCSAAVTVQDTIDPEITVALDRSVLWPPNHKLVDVASSVLVSDICDPDAGFVLVSITSDEPEDGLGDGDTPDDIQGDEIGTADTLFRLRAERSALGDGRTYTIAYTAFDSSGNTSPSTVTVEVPHDRPGQAKGGAGFNALGTALVTGASTFELIVPTSPDLDATLIALPTAQVGNTTAVIAARRDRLADVNGDGRLDRIFEFPAAEAQRVQKASGSDNPLAFRYGTADGVFFLVPDIWRLGAPIRGL